MRVFATPPTQNARFGHGGAHTSLIVKEIVSRRREEGSTLTFLIEFVKDKAKAELFRGGGDTLAIVLGWEPENPHYTAILPPSWAWLPRGSFKENQYLKRKATTARNTKITKIIIKKTKI